MANGFKGEIGLRHAGAEYVMVLDFNALCDFEGETGKNALQALEGMEQGEVSASDLRALMWAGLRQNHPEITLKQAGAILAENTDAIQRASAAAAPDMRGKRQGQSSGKGSGKKRPRP